MNQVATTAAPKPRRGREHRLSGADLSMAEEVFKSALLLLVPDDQKQRKAFEALMPYMFVLRNKGTSWEQLTKLLNECGFKLQPSTVRNYFGEMQQIHMDICQQRMNEQILLMNEVKKQTRGVDISAIAGQISGIMDKQRAAAGPRIAELFGTSPGATAPANRPGEVVTGSHREPASPASAQNTEPPGGNHREPASPAPFQPREPASPAHEKNGKPASPARQKNAGLRPAPEPLADDDHGFGLLQASSNVTPAASPTFFDLDDAPTIPVLNVTASDSAQPDKKAEMAAAPQATGELDTSTWRCRKLTDGVPPLKQRTNVPAGLYEEGNLEHPAIPGVMLTLAERLYGTALEFTDDNGEVHVETLSQKRFRVMWQKPIPSTPTMTSKNFTDMDLSLFGKTT